MTPETGGVAQGARPAGRRRAALRAIFVPLLVVTAVPPALSWRLWLHMMRGERPLAWDGAGHYAVAQIYTGSIFPEVFGWTAAYFGGMPFPNFYPPLYFWLVGLLTRSHLFSFNASFKLVTFLPVLLMPASVWLLSYVLSSRSRLAATASALGCAILLLDERFLFLLPAGLDYFSTFQIGLYTQPLGFVLMVAWYILYSGRQQTLWRVGLASLLLALTVLANFFAAATAGVFIITIVVRDAYSFYGETDSESRRRARKILLAHLASPLLAACLALFWVVPVIEEYGYFVTKPYVIESGQFYTPSLALWYVLAAAGCVLWLRRPTREAWPYVSACAALAIAGVFAATLSPHWFPLQAPRFLATLNFLLCVPVGRLAAEGFRRAATLLGEAKGKGQALTLKHAPYTTVAALALVALFVLTTPAPRWGNARAFYGEAERVDITQLLAFAREHHDGRYLVEVINPTLTPMYADASFEARALNSYLGSQGNETLAAVFHEDSPSALFMLPAVNALSVYPDSFGVSSALADDLDFAAQPLSRHIERARLLGVKYVVSRTPSMKEKLAREASFAARRDFGWWSVFELKDEPPPAARVLANRPALVISPLSLKLRRSNEWSFTRLAEEQFSDGWFDVLLTLSHEKRIDRLGDLERFGALIVESYEYDDESRAYDLLKQFSQARELILISDDSELFRRISAARAEFPKLDLIEREKTGAGEPMEALQPTRHYQDNSVRRSWAAIRGALEKSKVPVADADAAVSLQLDENRISLTPRPAPDGSPVPVLVARTFHPNWIREDGGDTYAATPFYTLTFAEGPLTLTYRRSRYEKAAGLVSAGSLTVVCLLLAGAALRYNRKRRGGR